MKHWIGYAFAFAAQAFLLIAAVVFAFQETGWVWPTLVVFNTVSLGLLVRMARAHARDMRRRRESAESMARAYNSGTPPWGLN